MTDQAVAISSFPLFFNEFFGTRKGNLINKSVNFIGCHTDSAVGYRNGFFLLIKRDLNRKIAQFSFKSSPKDASVLSF